MNLDGLLVRPTGTGVRVEVRVSPRARRNSVDGVREGRLVVRVTAPPVDRAANDAVILLLADRLSLPKRAIRIVSGETSRQKSVEIEGLSPAELLKRLAD